MTNETNQLVDWFVSELPFPIDSFQLEALEAIAEGNSVLVAAPTGSGKTLIAEFALHVAIFNQRRAVYTSPLKALSNEKFRQFCNVFGHEHVGLLTGDVSINPNARIVVMTTEVLRNMLYQNDPSIDEFTHVVLDEIHYLQDPERGSTWEEVILLLPEEARLVCLSATISNTEQFGGWLRAVRGNVVTIVKRDRPVPLEVCYCYQDPRTEEAKIRPLFQKNSKVINPSLQKLIARYRYNRSRYALVPHRLDVIECLQNHRLLPAIFFIFSRVGCERALSSAIRSGISLVDPDEGDACQRFALERVESLSDEELRILGFGEFLEGLRRGVSIHHAGMIHPFKEIVENLFADGLLKVVFATETLSLGIDMPARSVVIENLYKFDGTSHKLVTAAEFTQLSGRAGRRGKDERGFAVVIHSPWLPLEEVGAVARSTRFHLSSSFRPGYNMVANMVLRYERPEQAYEVLRRSFAAYQRGRMSGELRAGSARAANPKSASKPGETLSSRLGREGPRHRKRLSLELEFDGYLCILRERNFVRGEWSLTDKGLALTRVFSERDACVVEWVHSRAHDGLDVEELAFLLSGWAADARSDSGVEARMVRNKRLRGAAKEAEEIVRNLRKHESDVFGNERTPLPNFAHAALVAEWCRRHDPESLFDSALDPGDAIRHLRRVIDLARQLHESTGDARFREVAEELDAGIVASAVPGAESAVVGATEESGDSREK
jgi:superfamily II RNA helicase